MIIIEASTSLRLSASAAPDVPAGTMTYHPILYYPILSYNILYYPILSYIILYYTILSYNNPDHRSGELAQTSGGGGGGLTVFFLRLRTRQQKRGKGVSTYEPDKNEPDKNEARLRNPNNTFFKLTNDITHQQPKSSKPSKTLRGRSVPDEMNRR